MSETTIVEEQQLPVEPTAQLVPVEAVEVPELRYEYQPTDENGLPMGGKQVLKYKTTDELIEKIKEQNVSLQRRLRQETRKNRLGIVEDEQIPESAPRFAAPVEFKKGDLTAEQRYSLSKNIMDPDKFEEVADALFEYAMGAKPAEVRGFLSTVQEREIQAEAKTEADAFVATTPEYIKCDSNYEAITGWMVRYKLAPKRQNFRRAFDTLKADGLLIVNEPIAADPPPALPAVETPPVVVPPPPAPPAVSIPGLPSGLSRERGASDAGTPRSLGDDIVYEVKDRQGRVIKTLTGMAAVNAMPSEEMKRRLRHPAFSKAVDKLETEASARAGRIAPSILDR